MRVERKSRLMLWKMQRGDPDQLLRTNQRTNERYVAILCRVEDAALKFRGCFQAICELRSENQQGEDRPEGGVPADRAWSSLNPSIHPSSATSLSLSSSSHPDTTLSLPLFPFLSLFAPLPTSPHFLSHFHCLVTVRPLARPPFVCSAYGGAQKRTVTS